MKHPLKVYGLLTSVLLLQSCDKPPVTEFSQSKGQIVLRKDLGEQGNQYLAELIREEVTKKKTKEKHAASLSVKTKHALARSPKQGKRKVAASVGIESNSREAKKRQQPNEGKTVRRAKKKLSVQRLARPHEQERLLKGDVKIDSAEERKQTKAKQLKQVEPKLEEKLARYGLDTDAIDASYQLSITSLPLELLQRIFSYLTFEEMLPSRGVNLFFYYLTTGYNQVGVVGIENKPTGRKLVNSWYVGSFVCFKSNKEFEKGIWNHETIPSFIFYQFMESVSSLPEAYWYCLPDTHIKGLSLHIHKITSEQATKLGTYLVGNKLCVISLVRTQLEDMGVKGLSKYLSKTSIEIVKLGDNRIGPQGAKALFKNLQGSRVTRIDLSRNMIGNEGLRYLGKYIAKIPVERLWLNSNKIELEVIRKFLKGLGKETSLKEIYLGGNELTYEEWKLLKAEYTHINVT
jgi:hypothetical protein